MPEKEFFSPKCMGIYDNTTENHLVINWLITKCYIAEPTNLCSVLWKN